MLSEDSANKVGIFSQIKSLDEIVNDGDRIEIYRPLIADPKEVRKKRAEQQREQGIVKWIIAAKINLVWQLIARGIIDAEINSAWPWLLIVRWMIDTGMNSAWLYNITC